MMRTISFIPEKIAEFVSFANDMYAHDSNASFDLLAAQFIKLRHYASAAVQAILLSETSSLIATPNNSAVGWDTNQVLLEVNPHYSLGISILHVTPPHLLNAVSHAAYIVIGPAAFEFSMYKLPDSLQREVFAPKIVIHTAQQRVLSPGECLRVHAGIDLIDWRIQAPVMLLRLIAAPVETIQWTFRRDPLRPWFVASVDPGATQLSALCAYFAAVGNTGAAPAVTVLRTHRNHQVRWEATKALWKINRKLGVEALYDSLSDIHPHVRNAAAKTVEKIKQSQGDPHGHHHRM